MVQESDEVSAAMLRVTRDLLATGERLGEAGSAHIVAGRTLWHHHDAIRSLVTDVSRADAFLHAAIEPVPEGVVELDRYLRDTFAPVAGDLKPMHPAGWLPAEPVDPGPVLPLADSIASWEELGVPEQAAEALRRLDALCAEASGWSAYAASADRIRRDVRRAAGVLSLDAPSLSAEARAALGYAFDRVCAETDADLAGAMEEFRTLGLIASTLPALGALPTPDRGAAYKAASDIIERSGATGSDTGHCFQAAKAALVLFESRAAIGDEKMVVRQLRPAWRAMDRRLDRIADQTAALVPRLLDDPGAMGDPAVLAQLAHHRAGIEDMRMIQRSSDALTRLLDGSPAALEPRGEPVVARPWNGPARQLLSLGQALGAQASDEVAVDALRFACERINRYASVPGEQALRAAVTGGSSSPWDRLSGNRHADLLKAIESRRELWIADFTDNPAADSPLLEALTEACADLHLLVTLADALDRLPDDGRTSPGAIQAWPGFELSAEAWQALLDAAQPVAAGAIEAALDGRDLQAMDLLLRLEAEHAAALLAAHLEREAIARGLSRAAEDSPVHQVIAGALHPDCWLASSRPQIACVCRYVEEWAAADEAQRRPLIEFANARARTVLEALEFLR